MKSNNEHVVERQLLWCLAQRLQDAVELGFNPISSPPASVMIACARAGAPNEAEEGKAAGISDVTSDGRYLGSSFGLIKATRMPLSLASIISNLESTPMNLESIPSNLESMLSNFLDISEFWFSMLLIL